MRRFTRAVLLIAAGAATGPAQAQQATEQFIPLGQSPGVSGKLTWIGTVAATDARAKTLSLTEGETPRSVKVTDKTRIFLDRSKLKQTNVTGTFADLQPGRRVEVMYAGLVKPPAADGATVADWIKIEITQP